MHIRPWEHVHMTVEEIDRAIDACRIAITATPMTGQEGDE